MTERTSYDLIEALDELLEEERAALLSGNLDTIERLLAQKEGLIDDLSRLDPSEAENLRGLSKKVGRNQVLLESAMDGIRAVSERLSEMRRLKTTLDTYDSSGTKHQIEVAKDRNLEKRA